ncbi:MAG: hypothetical protein Q8L04_09575 [Ignavibacteria bacterium]|nr:hypothetical protein [Ignavibacteria bacterium]
MKLIKTKSSIYKIVLSATFLIAFFCTSQTINATCFVCLKNGQCGELKKSCGDYRIFSCIVSCEDCSIATYNPQTDHIIKARNGGAWIVKNNKKILIFGEKFESFLTELGKKYANAKTDDKQVQKRIIAELNAFSKTDDHKVSSELLAHMSKETGLKIRNE